MEQTKFTINGVGDEIILHRKMDVDDAQNVINVAVLSAMAILENQNGKELIPLMALNMIDGILSTIKEHISGEADEYVQVHSKIN